jgi:hypothetical protein
MIYVFDTKRRLKNAIRKLLVGTRYKTFEEVSLGKFYLIVLEGENRE